MLKRFLIIVVFFISAKTTNAQHKQQGVPPPPPPTVSTHSVFGKYYKLDKYNVEVPFNNYPNVSPKKEAADRIYNSYQYAFPKPEDDINMLYGVDIVEFKSNSKLTTTESRLNAYVSEIKAMYAGNAKATLVSEKTSGAGYLQNVRQRLKADAPQLGKFYITSFYMVHKNLVIRMFVFTKTEAENRKIEHFFNTIRV